MQKNILWTGVEYYSVENCLLTITNQGSEISSVIIGSCNNDIYKIEYNIKTNTNWETIFFEIRSQVFNKIEITSFQGDGKGNWTTNGKALKEFEGCTDIDIPLTPFTNTLPIRRLKLLQKEEQQISVIYVNILEQQTKQVHQKYARLSESDYKYENVPNDFEATITVDDLGIVINYPGLFKRTLIQESSYR